MLWKASTVPNPEYNLLKTDWWQLNIFTEMGFYLVGWLVQCVFSLKRWWYFGGVGWGGGEGGIFFFLWLIQHESLLQESVPEIKSSTHNSSMYADELLHSTRLTERPTENKNSQHANRNVVAFSGKNCWLFPFNSFILLSHWIFISTPIYQVFCKLWMETLRAEVT